jgi:hypothetical protein
MDPRFFGIRPGFKSIILGKQSPSGRSPSSIKVQSAGIGLENESVGGNRRFDNLPEDGRNVFQLGWPESEKIDILCRPGSFLVPQGKQHCALEQKLIGVP